ncbi:hypothetical protein CBM2585_A130139 [Cupriavidus taiwanensis]|nr:hypothetical protein CBM2585_A130139 [Cupriavidus taiwanensis]
MPVPTYHSIGRPNLRMSQMQTVCPSH